MNGAVETVIVGTGFKGATALHAVARLQSGDEIRLIREPTNRHDPLAVACHFLGVHVGYVPRQSNPRVAEAIDAGFEVSARCTTAAVIGRNKVTSEPKILVTWKG